MSSSLIDHIADKVINKFLTPYLGAYDIIEDPYQSKYYYLPPQSQQHYSNNNYNY